LTLAGKGLAGAKGCVLGGDIGLVPGPGGASLSGAAPVGFSSLVAVGLRARKPQAFMFLK